MGTGATPAEVLAADQRITAWVHQAPTRSGTTLRQSSSLTAKLRMVVKGVGSIRTKEGEEER